MYKTEIPVATSLLVGLLIVLSYFLNIPGLQVVADTVLRWAVVIAGFALGLGAVNLFQVHSKRIRTKTRTWLLSIWLLTVMVVTFVIGLTQGTQSPAYSFIFKNMYSALGATVYSMHAFFLPAAAFRAFRISNFESGLFLLTGLLVMLGQVGIGSALWGGFPLVRGWILSIPSSAAMRGITITSALGLVSTGLRVILGLDRAYLGSTK